MTACLRFLSLTLVSVTLFSFSTAQAQSLFSDSVYGAGSDLSLTMTPTHPEPGDTVHLVAKSSSLDLSSSSITWSANGHILKSAANMTEIDIPAGTLGTETDITLSATSPDGGAGSAQATIIPTQMDLLYDANSYVPPFYEGRTLPSAGTTLNLQAIAHFKRSNGTSVAPSDITYTWRKNGVVLGSMSGRGKSAITVPSPGLFETTTFSVDAVSSDQTLAGSASAVIASVEPLLILYQDHPLFGITYYNALGTQTGIADTEMSFAATPYFAQAVSANDPRLVYDWKVNNTAITADPKNPSEITINADNSDGNAAISLEATHVKNYLMDSKGSWTVSFSTGGSFVSGVKNVIKDVFHSTN